MDRESRIPATDALVTNQPGICLMVLSADCVPVLLFEPEKRVVAAVHAGWRGTAANIVVETVRVMQENFGCDPQRVVAAIGPSIGKCCCEVGEEVARRTFNPHIGVEGGLSVLGTSGIVEPMSQQAILDTIQLEMNQAVLRAGTPKRLILAPGNYGLDYLHDTYPAFAAIPVVKTSNYIGDTMGMAAAAGFEQVLLVGHVGKLVKVAGGIMNTHSHTADCRTELFCTHAALCGASREVCAALMNAATTDACLELLDSVGLRAPVLESLLRAVQLHLDRRACGAFRVGAVLFSNQHGPLGATDTAAQLLNEWKEH